MQDPKTVSDRASQTEPAQAAVRGRRRYPVRWANFAILLVLVCLIGYYRGELARRVRFWRTGRVEVAGMVLALNPDDQYLTEVILDSGTYEGPESAVVRDLLNPGDTFVDVGANVGWYTLLAAKIVGAQGRVIAFEPEPRSFGYLKENVALNGLSNVTLVPKALLDKDGTITFFVHQSNKGAHSVAKSADRPSAIEVEAVTFDGYAKTLGGPIHLIKIDTEGAECHILKGMMQTLKAHAETKLLIEFIPRHLRAADCDPDELLSTLWDAGFRTDFVEGASLLPIDRANYRPFVALVDAGHLVPNLLCQRAAGTPPSSTKPDQRLGE